MEGYIKTNTIGVTDEENTSLNNQINLIVNHNEDVSTKMNLDSENKLLSSKNLMSMSNISDYSTYDDEDIKPIDGFKHPKECINLIQQMLVRDPKNRINVEDILSHQWCKNNHNKTNTNIMAKGKEIIANLKNFHVSNNWWSLALYRFFVHQIVTTADKEEIEEVFKYLDEDYGGELDRQELVKGLRKIDNSITSKFYQTRRSTRSS